MRACRSQRDEEGCVSKHYAIVLAFQPDCGHFQAERGLGHLHHTRTSGTSLCSSGWGEIRVTGWTALIRFQAGVRFFLLHNVQKRSAAHPASYPMGSGGKADNSSPFSAEIKSGGAKSPLLHTSSWHND
jgi:hypothetical protein